MISMIDNETIAAILLELADLVDIKGDDPFKSRAYRLAADRIARLSEDVATLAAQDRLREIPGVGDAIARKIDEIIATGTLRLRDQLRAEIPSGVLDLLRVPGIGPRTASLLYRAGVTGIADLRAALDDGRLNGIKGLGPKKIENLRRDLDAYAARTARWPAADLWTVAQAIAEVISTLPGVSRVEVAGSLRRHAETARDIDLVAAADDPGPIVAWFVSWEEVTEVLATGEDRVRVRLRAGPEVDLVVARPPAYAVSLLRMTGSRAHVGRLDALARERGRRLDSEDFATEAEIYAAAGLEFVPPELREDAGEIELAARGALPALVRRADLRGDLHCHTTYSDGTRDLLAMAEAARARGLTYLAITDHSPSLAVAHGLSRERLLAQKAEIDRLNAGWHDFRLFWGMEVDILPDGRLDMDDETLAMLDVVVASVHTAFHQPRETMTARVCRALENPHVDIFAHPTGRLLGRRDPYGIDLDEVMRACARHGVALEINSHPLRLELDEQHARQARAMGIQLAVDSDAHGPGGFDDLDWGVYVARRAWLEPADVLNTMPAGDLLAWLRRRS